MEHDLWAENFGADQLDSGLPMPLYHQIYLLLRAKIRSGQLAAGAFLPGEQELARLFHVSRITVKRSLNELASDGLVTRHRGLGTVISSVAPLPVVKGSFATLLHSLQVMGLETDVELLDVVDVEADTNVAQQLALPPGSTVQRATRRRKIEGEPFSHLVSFVPAAIAKRYSIEALATVPLLTLLERANAAAHSAEQWITAVAADPQIAAALGVEPAAALLRIERVMRSVRNAPVQLIYGHYRPDRFQYHLQTHRRRHAKGGDDSWQEEL
jgi:GntR family transcriptional regulator